MKQSNNSTASKIIDKQDQTPCKDETGQCANKKGSKKDMTNLASTKKVAKNS